MDLQLAGRVIFIAGASRGIGLGIADACLAEGAKVALIARGADALKETADRLAGQHGRDRVWAVSGDMRKTADVEKAVGDCETHFGPIWGAVANVGIHPCPPGFDVDDESWDAGIDQNLGSSFRVARAALRRMTPRGEGAILLISSIAGLAAMGSGLTYGTAKAAVNHLSGELAKIAALGIKVRKGCAYHGIALNVAMDLSPFLGINPCGYEGLRTVDLSTCGVDVSLEGVGDLLAGRLSDSFEAYRKSSHSQSI